MPQHNTKTFAATPAIAPSFQSPPSRFPHKNRQITTTTLHPYNIKTNTPKNNSRTPDPQNACAQPNKTRITCCGPYYRKVLQLPHTTYLQQPMHQYHSPSNHTSKYKNSSLSSLTITPTNPKPLHDPKLTLTSLRYKTRQNIFPP